MKKTLLTMLCLMAMSASYAQTTKRIMTVQQKDGTKVEYKVDNVERVSFSDKVYADLNNQWAFNEEVNPVNTVLFAESGENSLLRFILLRMSRATLFLILQSNSLHL